MTKQERQKIRLNILLTKAGELTSAETEWVNHLKKELNYD